MSEKPKVIPLDAFRKGTYKRNPLYLMSINPENEQDREIYIFLDRDALSAYCRARDGLVGISWHNAHHSIREHYEKGPIDELIYGLSETTGHQWRRITRAEADVLVKFEAASKPYGEGVII